MFGYVVVNKPELKLREYTEYQGYYCGLCHMLRKKYGISAGFTLTYDMTFLILLLGSLYEPRLEMKKRHCPIHPVKKKPMIRSEVTEYAADMNILLSHDHLRDDWEDEKKLPGLVGGLAFRRRARYVEKRYPRQAQVVSESLRKLSTIENDYLTHWKQLNSSEDWQKKIGGDMSAGLTVDIDEVSRPFGELMGELFVWKDDSFAPILRRLGFFLGKYIYIRDALDDIEKDRKKGCFNPFLYNNLDSVGDDSEGQKTAVGPGSKADESQNTAIEPGSRAEINMILDVTRRTAIAEFEKLPLERNITILRNILYEGIVPKETLRK